MYYSAIGILAAVILLIENHDILTNANAAFDQPAWKVFRKFLFAVLAYYTVDILWGITESLNHPHLLFHITSVYFVLMAIGIFYWTQYTVIYLDEDNRFGRLILSGGKMLALAVTALTCINFFKPVLFSVSADGVYSALSGRYVILGAQIAVLLLISFHTGHCLMRHHNDAEQSLRYQTLLFFGLIMAGCLFGQLYFPYLPLYSVAYMLGTCMLRAVVISNEKENYRLKLEETQKVAELKQSIDRIKTENESTKDAYEKARSTNVIYTHIAQTLAHGYRQLFHINVTNGDFIEYDIDNKHNILNEVRRDTNFFEQCLSGAEERVHPDDLKSFVKAMDKDTLMNVLDKNGTFIMTYRQRTDHDYSYVSMRISRMEDDRRFIIVGITDINEQMKQEKAAERIKEEHIAYARINALTGDFIAIYIEDPVSERYRRYSVTDGYESLNLPADGVDFFAAFLAFSKQAVYADDQKRFQLLFSKENILSEMERTGIFAFSYRMMIDGKPRFVQFRASRIEEREVQRLIFGITDIDAEMRQEEEYAKRLASAQSQANIDALTGVKNRHAYLNAEQELDDRIAAGENPDFAIVILDVNDLKKINDTKGHQAGDEYLCTACKIICDIFAHSPVFRIGGDEFAVLAQSSDYANIDTLVETVQEHNRKAGSENVVVVACGMAKKNTEDTCVASVFERADSLMYQNKNDLKSAVH